MRIIVTRPEQDAPSWARVLCERGHEVTTLPLIEIGAAPEPAPLQQAWSQLSHYHALMFVSGNAVVQFCAAQQAPTLAAWLQRAPHTRAWATGPGTRKALLSAGVAPQLIDAPEQGQFDSEALWRLVQGGVQAGQRVLIVRGGDGRAGDASKAQGVGRDWLAQALQAAGVEAELVVAYTRCLPHWSDAQLERARSAAQDGSLWLFSSSEAIANLQQLLAGQDWRAARALATHPRIAQAARAAGFAAVRESRPSLAEVLASIESQG